MADLLLSPALPDLNLDPATSPDDLHQSKMDTSRFTLRATEHLRSTMRLYLPELQYALMTVPLMCTVSGGNVEDFPLMVAIDDTLPGLRDTIGEIVAPRRIRKLKMRIFSSVKNKYEEVEVTDANVAQLIRFAGDTFRRGLLMIDDVPGSHSKTTS